MAMDDEAGRQAGRRLLRADGKPLYYIPYVPYIPSATCASSMVGRNSSHPDADTVRPGALQTHRIGYVP